MEMKAAHDACFVKEQQKPEIKNPQLLLGVLLAFNKGFSINLLSQRENHDCVFSNVYSVSIWHTGFTWRGGGPPAHLPWCSGPAPGGSMSSGHPEKGLEYLRVPPHASTSG